MSFHWPFAMKSHGLLSIIGRAIFGLEAFERMVPIVLLKADGLVAS